MDILISYLVAVGRLGFEWHIECDESGFAVKAIDMSNPAIEFRSRADLFLSAVSTVHGAVISYCSDN